MAAKQGSILKTNAYCGGPHTLSRGPVYSLSCSSP